MHLEVQPKSLFRLLNQIFELERKAARLEDGENVLRQVRRMKELFEEDFHLTYEIPRDSRSAKPARTLKRALLVTRRRIWSSWKRSSR